MDEQERNFDENIDARQLGFIVGASVAALLAAVAAIAIVVGPLTDFFSELARAITT